MAEKYGHIATEMARAQPLLLRSLQTRKAKNRISVPYVRGNIRFFMQNFLSGSKG
jgi:hypothetical protein